jgi:hypothetical protein
VISGVFLGVGCSCTTHQSAAGGWGRPVLRRAERRRAEVAMRSALEQKGV